MRRRVAGALLAVVLAAGCATQDGSPRIWLPGAEPAESEADRMLQYYARVSTLKGTELNKEFAAVRAAFEQEQSEINRVRLAMLLSLPESSFRDDGRALELVVALNRDTRYEDSPLRPLTVFMQGFLADARRAEETLQAQGAKLRDEQRRAEALQQKLEALLEMEMKMIEREQAAQPRKR